MKLNPCYLSGAHKISRNKEGGKRMIINFKFSMLHCITRKHFLLCSAILFHANVADYIYCIVHKDKGNHNCHNSTQALVFVLRKSAVG